MGRKLKGKNDKSENEDYEHHRVLQKHYRFINLRSNAPKSN